MTLALTVLSHRLCVVCADRRLTSGERVIKEEHDKAIVIFTDDGRAVLTFSGLATAQSFDTHKWLMKAVADLAGPPDYTFLKTIMNGLGPKLTEEFRTNKAIQRLGAKNRRLSVLIAGYVYKGDQNIPLFSLTSNFQRIDQVDVSLLAADEFTHTSGYINDDGARTGETLTLAIGNTTALSPQSAAELKRAAQNASVHAITERIVDVIRTTAFDGESKETIGKQIDSVSIPPTRSGSVLTDYHPAVSRRELTIMPAVWATSKDPGIASGITIAPEDPTIPPIARPPKLGRNQKCYCGSGQKFKRCHGDPRKG